MNKVYLGIITIVACACICVGQTSNKQKTAPLAEKSSKRNQAVLSSGTSINAELQKTLSVNDAKVGDQVVLKTTQAIKQNGEVVVPRGANLIGRVTEVQRRTRENTQSRIGMVFDRIQGKELSMPLSATLTSITSARAQAAAGDDSFMSDVSGSSSTAASSSRSSSGGGLLGGVGSTVGGLVNTTTQTVGNVTNAAGQTVGTTTGTVGRTLDGIQISTTASGSANSSTTLSSSNKNLRVEKGATFHLRVAN